MVALVDCELLVAHVIRDANRQIIFISYAFGEKAASIIITLVDGGPASLASVAVGFVCQGKRLTHGLRPKDGASTRGRSSRPASEAQQLSPSPQTCIHPSS